jgi:hypothetical protein
MNVRLLALLLPLLWLGAPRVEAHTFISPGGLYTLSYERPWVADPSMADDGELFLECDDTCGNDGARLTFSERPETTKNVSSNAVLIQLATSHWREIKAHQASVKRRFTMLRQGFTRVDGVPVHESLVELDLGRGYVVRRLVRLALRDGKLVTLELRAPTKTWRQAQAAAQAVVATLRWVSDRQPLLMQAHALREAGRLEDAFALYDRPELAGHPVADYWAGLMRYTGEGTPRHQGEGVGRLINALAQGYLAAGRVVAVAALIRADHATGEKSEDCELALTALRAAQRSVYAATVQQYLGRLHQTGLCVDKHLGLAIHFFEKAASAGNRDAARDLARLYEDGTEVEQDPDLAAHWKQVSDGTAKP